MTSAETPRCDPSASALAIGQLSCAPSMIIPPGTDLVQTSGFGVAPGTGQALYAFDPAVDDAYVAANPLAAFIAANERGFRLSLSQPITPFMFGAVGNEALGDAATDDADALEAWFRFLIGKRVPMAFLAGDFRVDRTILADAAYGDGRGLTGDRHLTTTIFAHARIRAGADMDHLLHIKRWPSLRVVGQLHLLGGLDGDVGGTPWTRRHVFTGLYLESSPNAAFDVIQAENFKYAAVETENSPSNTNLTSIHHLHGKRVGSAPDGARGGGITANVTARRDTGSPGSFDQRSILTVDSLPPTYFDAPRRTINIRLGGLGHPHADILYTVTAIDRAARTIAVTPWLPAGVDAIPIDYFSGAMLVARGSDANLLRVGTLSAQGSAGGYDANCLYGGEIGTLHCEGRGIALRIGGSTDHAVLGLKVNRLYCEGCVADVMLQTASAVNVQIHAASPIDWAKVMTGIEVRDGALTLSQHSGMRGVEISSDTGGSWSNRRRPGTSVILDFNEPTASGSTYHGDAIAFDLAPLDEQLRRLFLLDGGTVTCHGTAPHGGPASVTFNPRQGFTVNGTASARFEGLSAPTTFSVRLAKDTTDWSVQPIGR